MRVPLSFRLPIVAIFASALAVAQVGCRSKAHNDLYRQRMANEIRVLEDQIYDADYKNRVLRDRLERVSAGTSTQSTTPAPSAAADQSQTDTSPELPSLDGIDTGEGFDPDELALPTVDEGAPIDVDDEFALPMIDEGSPVDPDSLTDPLPVVPGVPVEGDAPMLPAPGGPEPPGIRDTEAPQVVPGEPAPPAAPGQQLKPPGQVIIPDSAQAALSVPEKLRIHAGLSGGHVVDGQVEGMMIVVTAVDKFGRMVSLDGFDVDADLTIVILDPQLEPSKARLGRWDYSNQQVATFLRSKPISGLHVPIQWSNAVPSSDEVIVHVRLRAEDDEMRCDGRVKVAKKTALAEWTPRGESLP